MPVMAEEVRSCELYHIPHSIHSGYGNSERKFAVSQFDLYGADIYGSVAAPSSRAVCPAPCAAGLCRKEPVLQPSLSQKESKPALGAYDGPSNGFEDQLADQQRRISDLEVKHPHMAKTSACAWPAQVSSAHSC